MTRYQKAFFVTLAISLAVAFSPLKELAYLLPYVGFLLLVCVGQRWVILRNLGLLGMAYIFLVMLHAAFGPEFVWQNAVLWLMTNGTLLFLLAVPSRGLYSEELGAVVMRLVLLFLLVESFWGVGQALQGYLYFGNLDGAIGISSAAPSPPFPRKPRSPIRSSPPTWQC